MSQSSGEISLRQNWSRELMHRGSRENICHGILKVALTVSETGADRGQYYKLDYQYIDCQYYHYNYCLPIQGPARGEQWVSRGGESFHSFRGIPYAKPPVGIRRFKLPESFQDHER